MSLASDLKADAQVAKRLRLPWWGMLCCIVAGIPIIWLCDHFGRLNLALPTFDSVGMIAVAIAVKWKLRRQVWFWITIIVLMGLHVLLILSVPWTDQWVPALALVPFGLADLWVMLALISAVRQLVERPDAVDG